jgi:hypothetical protein
MSYKLKGSITAISEIADAGNGKKLSFRIDTKEQYNNIVEFEMFKGADYVEHLDKFTKFNKVGDDVEVEFNLKTFNWKPESDNKIFTSLSAWRVEKADAQPQEVVAESSTDELPF